MKTTIELAREAAGDEWYLFREFMPEIHKLAELIRADERARMAEQPAQPSKPWVGLTEPERLACYDLNPARFASAIEAKLKEKNT